MIKIFFCSYFMQKVEEMKITYKQCQDVLDCAEKRLQTNGLGVTTEGSILSSSSSLNIEFLTVFLV